MWLRCPKTRIRLSPEIGGEGSSKQRHREYGCSLRRVRCQANGLAYAKSHSASAVFARHEKDLDAEIKRKRFDVDVLFLEDLKV